MTDFKSLRPMLPILLGAALMLSLAMGLRQSLGIFLPPLTKDLGITVSQFTIAIAIQNLTWGLLQPFTGALAVRTGFRPLMLAGATLYVLGMLSLTMAGGFWGVVFGAGIAVGASMACMGSAFALAVAARATPLALRSTVLGMVSAVGSLGALFAAPTGQALIQSYGWRAGALAFLLIALFMIPAAWFAGRVDRLAIPHYPGNASGQNAREVLRSAMRTPAFVVMTVGYFVCGMQLVFLTTHLPSYLEICGMDPMLGAQALGVIGGFNVLGSLFFGWAGGRINKLLLLASIYVVRSLMLIWYFIAAPTPATTLIFAAVMGFLWLGVAPLVAGWVADKFGLRWQAMLGGVAFMSHQLGSFTGAFGGGLIYQAFGSYTLAWQGGVAIGLVAGIVQGAFALSSNRRPPAAAAA